jgi:hypothetical protein
MVSAERILLRTSVSMAMRTISPTTPVVFATFAI